jgi:hypothetical protein
MILQHSKQPRVTVLFSPPATSRPNFLDQDVPDFDIDNLEEETGEVIPEIKIEPTPLVDYRSSPEPTADDTLNQYDTVNDTITNELTVGHISALKESPILPDGLSPGYDPDLELEIDHIFEELESTKKKKEIVSGDGKRSSVSRKVLDAIIKNSPGVERVLFIDDESEPTSDTKTDESFKLDLSRSYSPTMSLRMREGKRWASSSNLKRFSTGSPLSPNRQNSPFSDFTEGSISSSGGKREVFRGVCKKEKGERRIYLSMNAKELTVKKRRKVLRTKKLVMKIPMNTMEVSIDGDWCTFEDQGEEKLLVRVDEEQEKFAALLLHYIALTDENKDKNTTQFSVNIPRVRVLEKNPHCLPIETLAENYKEFDSEQTIESEVTRAKDDGVFSPLIILSKLHREKKLHATVLEEGDFYDATDDFF